VRRFLSTPTGWFVLLLAEIVILSAFMRWLLRLVPDLSRTGVWIIAIALIVVVTAANYTVRRRYLSGR
jgi:divalent metal cation (Fe/Co/Zn/Cd) transporter